jgi:ComF family protein
VALFQELTDALLHLAFPVVCEGCGTDVTEKQNRLCARCLSSLPQTNFHLHGGNPVEKIFWGRVPLLHATAQYYFTRSSLIQHLMHQLKYKGNKEIGQYLGALMGDSLNSSNRFASVDMLIPLPLFKLKEKKRGYNQAAVLCDGMAVEMQKPVRTDVIIRTSYTDSQTKKGRIERWKNMEGRFAIPNPALVEGKHLLLVDDVITTGATLEACALELLKIPGIQLSIATLCFASGS